MPIARAIRKFAHLWLLVVLALVLLRLFFYFRIFNFVGTKVPLVEPENINRKIWQLSNEPVDSIENEYRKYIGTWTRQNPTHQYELFTHESATEYVLRNYKKFPEITDTFSRIDDRILRADLFRYLLLHAEGGLYTDMDTECTRPIDDWLPSNLSLSAGLVLGLEYDARGGQVGWGFKESVSLAQFAIMAKPGHAVLWHVIETAIFRLQRFASGVDEDKIKAHTGDEVLSLTGPNMFTRAVLNGISTCIGQKITTANLSRLQEPVVFGDVIILPITAFGSGQQHSDSQPRGHPDENLFHHFRATWRADHGRS